LRSLNKAFSLLELSVILIIISILLISITSFDKLKSNVKQKAFYKELTQISEKINNFKLIYSYLPGDFPKAGKLFNHILARCDDEIINSGFGSTNRSGCNGDGDNIWDRALVSCCYGEGYMVWLHLQLANLLAAPYDGADYYYGYQYADNPLSDGNNLYSSKILAALYLPLTKNRWSP
jgi:type II secretory pathway pseudopilin PulG